MKTFEYVITDPEGIHARPAGQLVKLAKEFQSTVTLHYNGKSGDAKRIFSIMSLTAKQGAQLRIEVEGPDETAAAIAVERFFKGDL